MKRSKWNAKIDPLPTVASMSVLQIEVLRRKRARDTSGELNAALAATIHGISAGLRNTG